MDARSQAQPNRIYEDIDPPSDWVSDDGSETFLLHLPGFKKGQLRVQLTTSRLLRISGERPIGNNKWRRFHKETQVPSNCDIKEITAKYEDGILYIRQPKLITPAIEQQDKEKAAVEPPKTQPPPAALPSPPQPPAQPAAPSLALAPPKVQENEKTRDVVDSAKKAPEKEEETRKMEKEKKTKDEASDKGKESTLDKAKTVGLTKFDFLKELRKPGNRRRLIITSLMVLMLGMYASYILRILKREDDQEPRLVSNNVGPRM